MRGAGLGAGRQPAQWGYAPLLTEMVLPSTSVFLGYWPWRDMALGKVALEAEDDTEDADSW